MFEEILKAAYKEAIEVLKSPRRTGVTVGSTLVGGTVISYAWQEYRKIKQHDNSEKQLRVTRFKEIHHDVDKGFNDQGRGTLVAAIYTDDNGGLHKKVGNQWYTWNGTSWL
jgi:hypothetical protein